MSPVFFFPLLLLISQSNHKEKKMQTRAFALHPVLPACPLRKLSSDQSGGDAARPQRHPAPGRAASPSLDRPDATRGRGAESCRALPPPPARQTRSARGCHPALPPSGAYSHFQHNLVQDDAIHQLHVDAEVVLVPAPQGPEGFHLPGGRTGGLQGMAEGPHSSPPGRSAGSLRAAAPLCSPRSPRGSAGIAPGARRRSRPCRRGQAGGGERLRQ